MTDKPVTAAGYRAEETEQVITTCLTVASILGDLTDELCVVGGLVPSMICDTEVDPSALEGGAHVGTNDLDVALEVSVLDEEHYKEISARLRGKDLGPTSRPVVSAPGSAGDGGTRTSRSTSSFPRATRWTQARSACRAWKKISRR